MDKFRCTCCVFVRTYWDVWLPCCFSGMMQLHTCLTVFISCLILVISVTANCILIKLVFVVLCSFCGCTAPALWLTDITVHSNILEQVDNFIYFGSNQSSDGGSQSRHEAAHRSCISSHVVLTMNLELSVPVSANQSLGLPNSYPANFDICLWDLDSTRQGWKPSWWNANTK